MEVVDVGEDVVVVRFGVYARGDGGEDEDEEEAKAEVDEGRCLVLGAVEVVEEGEVGQEGGGKELGGEKV